MAKRQPAPSPRASASTGWAICKAQRLVRKAGAVEQHDGTHGLSVGLRMRESLPQTVQPCSVLGSRATARPSFNRQQGHSFVGSGHI